MAKRKYVKENNLVKAINTDSLELQKPLVNEYYDINVHNSNMDKIDKGYKQNKNDISSINSELSKTENTKYTTTNGIKEFSCKDGYVDNIVIEGQTKILNAENQECEAGVNGAKLVSVGQGDKIEVLTKNSDETKQDKKQILTTLRSLPNGVKDEIVKQGDKYYKIKRIIEFDSTSLLNSIDFEYIKTNHVCFYIRNTLDQIKINSYVLSDNFNYISLSDYTHDTLDVEGVTAGPAVGFRILKSRLSTIDKEGIKKWLISNPIIFICETPTPVIEEIPNFNPRTFDNKSTLLLNSGVVQGEASFEVTNSLGSELEVLKSKSSNLEEYVLNSEIHKLSERGIFNPVPYYQNIIYDLNNYMLNGTYNFYGNSSGANGYTTLNVPTGYSGSELWTLFVVGNVQFITSSRYTNDTFVRVYKYDKTWSSWQKITTISTLSLLEQQVSELEIQAMENEV